MVCWGSLRILDYVISTTNHFLLGGTGRSRGPIEAVSNPGIRIRIVIGERIFVVTLDTLGLFLGRFFLKAWKRNISQSS